MSILTVTAVETASETLSEALGTAATTLANGIAPIAWPIAAILGAEVLGKEFQNVWNKNRAKIPAIAEAIRTISKQVADLGSQVMQPRIAEARAVLNDATYNLQMDLINSVLKTDVRNELTTITNNFDTLSTTLLNQYIEWTQTLAIFYAAGSDNAFYTQNKNDIDTLINAYVSIKINIDKLEKFINQVSTTIRAIIDSIARQYATAAFIVTNVIASPTYNPVPNEAQRLRDRLDRTKNPALNAIGLPTTIPTLEQIAEYLKTKSATITKTRTKTLRAKKLRRKKRKTKKGPQKKRPPEFIRTISISTPKSNWIRKVTFTFPASEKIDSDRKGTLKFYLKKGTVIKKVRVKRGTFSVIAVWSIGTKLGVGYRYWSQFNKAAIVNKKVFSYSLSRITAQDREIAIPIEIYEKKVKYK